MGADFADRPHPTWEVERSNPHGPQAALHPTEPCPLRT